jgi:hypothetical protein
VRIEFTGLTPKTHRFAVLRDDGSVDAVQLETRSLLVHDLTHYAVEKVLGMQDAFYGRLARGVTLAQLSDTSAPWPEGSELALAETIVGPMQSFLGGRLARERLPEWRFIDAVSREFRSAFGKWNGTAWGSPCRLVWP